jgi:hypothetical protein
MPTGQQEVSAGHADDRGRQVGPQRPYRNLAVAAGAVFGIACGVALAAYLTINVAPLKGWGWIIGFPVGVAAGSTLGFFVLLKLADLLGRKR